MDEESLNSMITEWIFGLYSRWWTLDIINENNKQHYLSKNKRNACSNSIFDWKHDLNSKKIKRIYWRYTVIYPLYCFKKLVK